MRLEIVPFALIAFTGLASANPPAPKKPPKVAVETGGVIVVEAEDFVRQTENTKRTWHVVSKKGTPPQVVQDGDPPHVEGASGGAYLELLPDTRRTHDDKLIHGENFFGEPGKQAVLTYRVHFTRPGRYYVWARVYSTGPEDNGIHVGLDGTWPASGQRMQWCEGKNSWRWESRQRTEAQHCGVPGAIYLDVDKPGEREVQFSMREDGFELDKFLLTTDANFTPSAEAGPAARYK